MALWLVRSGKFGEYEQRFLSENKIFLTWNGLNIDLLKISDRAEMLESLQLRHRTFALAKLRNHAAQLWAFVHRMQPGDWVIVPSKTKPAISVAEITGGMSITRMRTIHSIIHGP